MNNYLLTMPTLSVSCYKSLHIIIPIYYYKGPRTTVYSTKSFGGFWMFKSNTRVSGFSELRTPDYNNILEKMTLFVFNEKKKNIEVWWRHLYLLHHVLVVFALLPFFPERRSLWCILPNFRDSLDDNLFIAFLVGPHRMLWSSSMIIIYSFLPAKFLNSFLCFCNPF